MQRLIAEVLRATLDAAHSRGDGGASYEAVARRIGGSKQHVGECCDPLSGRTLSLVKATLLGSELAPAFLRRLAARLEDESGARPDVATAALGVAASAGEVAHAVRAALRDGVIDDAEAATIEASLLDAEACITATRASLRAALAVARAKAVR